MPKKKTNEDILAVLNSLQKGQHIVVTWIDASESKGIDLKQNPLSNQAVETRKETTGIFVNVQKGYSYHACHLIIGIEKTDELWHINSIPVCLIKSIQVSNLKAPLSTIKNFDIKKKRKKILKLASGGYKILW